MPIISSNRQALIAALESQAGGYQAALTLGRGPDARWTLIRGMEATLAAIREAEYGAQDNPRRRRKDTAP